MTRWWQYLQQDWASDLDLSGGRSRAAWWSWLVLAAGALALMVAVDHADSLRAEQADAADQIKRLSRADRQMRLQRALTARAASADAAASMPTAAAQAKPATAPALQGAAVPAATRMVRQLAYPWQANLGQLDAHARQAQVVMTQLAVNLESVAQVSAGPQMMPAPQWRLQAAALDDASALAWTRLLPQGSLVSREPLKTPFSTRAGMYTLQVSASMQPPMRATVLPTPGAAP